MEIVCSNCNKVMSIEPDIKGYYNTVYDICNECYQEIEEADNACSSNSNKDDVR